MFVENNGKTNVYILDWEIGGFYDLIQIGDSIFKKSGSLDVNLRRKGIDTIVKMEFYTEWSK